MKLHLESNIAEGTPEELVEYLRLVEGNSSDNQLFSFGHAHQPTDSTETSTDEADLGEFYIVNVDDSALSKGTILKKVDKHTLKDSLGDEYLHVDANAVEHIDKQLYNLEDRFIFATQVGVRLSDSTDLAQATEGDYFKVTDSYAYLNEGDIVTIAEDDRDNQPLCKDEYGNSFYVLLGHLELIEEPTESSTEEAEEPSTKFQVGDKVRVLESACGAVGEATVTAVYETGEVEIAGTSREGIYLTNWSSHVTLLEKIEEVEEDEEVELQVGDKVRVLESACGAVGEATVTAVYETGEVEIAGTSREGIYLTNWSSHVTLLEKIEEVEEDEEVELQVGDRVKVLRSAYGAVGEATVTKVLEEGRVEIAGTNKDGVYLNNWGSNVLFLEKIEEEDVEVDPEEAEEDKLMGYTFWYLDTANFNKFVVLKASLEGYFEDSTGKRYTYQAVSGYVKPIDRESVREVFEEAEREGSLLKYFPTIDMFDKVY